MQSKLVDRFFGLMLTILLLFSSNAMLTAESLLGDGLCQEAFDAFAVEHGLRSSKDQSITFNANAMTNPLGSNPTIIFGTGVASPIMNAWKMFPSNSMQSPITIQFPIPEDLKKKKPVSLELHFLVKKQAAGQGSARIRVNAKYMSNGEDFNVLAVNPIFSDTADSADFLITEPATPVSVKHVCVTIPLDGSDIKYSDLALLSLTRTAPMRGTEYPHDIYLVAATFRYTQE